MTTIDQMIHAEDLKKLNHLDVQIAISKNKHIPDFIKVLLIESCENTNDPELQKFLASEPLTPLRIQKRLLSEGIEIRLLLARREDLKKTIATALAKDSDFIVRKEVAIHTIYPDVLTALSKDSNGKVVLAVASNPHTSAKTLEELVIANIKIFQEEKALAQTNSVDNTDKT